MPQPCSIRSAIRLTRTLLSFSSFIAQLIEGKAGLEHLLPHRPSNDTDIGFLGRPYRGATFRWMSRLALEVVSR